MVSLMKEKCYQGWEGQFKDEDTFFITVLNDQNSSHTFYQVIYLLFAMSCLQLCFQYRLSYLSCILVAATMSDGALVLCTSIARRTKKKKG